MLNTIEFKGEYIKLSQFLKLSGIVGQGSDAKMLILDSAIKVNGVVEIKKGKKIRNGDIISYNTQEFKAVEV